MKLTPEIKARIERAEADRARPVAALLAHTERRRAFIHDQFDRAEERFLEIMKRTPQ